MRKQFNESEIIKFGVETSVVFLKHLQELALGGT